MLDVRKYWRHGNCKCIRNSICMALVLELFHATGALGETESLVLGKRDCSLRFTVGV